ncbi:MAG: hypothetical protein FWD68_14165 [Alphaproteobacteria bacterium]|nr:hypothetical protein [Alphaproteobacteria bacterium]
MHGLVQWSNSGGDATITKSDTHDDRLVAEQTWSLYSYEEIRYEYDPEGDRLQRSLIRLWRKDDDFSSDASDDEDSDEDVDSDDEDFDDEDFDDDDHPHDFAVDKEGRTPELSQLVFTYDPDGVLARVTHQDLDEQGQPRPGPGRLEYLRLPDSESMETIEASVQSLLEQALAAALNEIPREERLYCLLLCFSGEDMDCGWPPFLVWGRESYRRSVLERGEAVGYYLWAPDEIRAKADNKGTGDEYWLQDQTLKDTFLLHRQLMKGEDSNASAMRVLEKTLRPLARMVRQAEIPVTDDFVIAFADSTGEISPLEVMETCLPPERWALLQDRGYV